MVTTIEKTKKDLVAMLTRIGVTSQITFTEKSDYFSTNDFTISGKEMHISIGKNNATTMVHATQGG